MPYEVIKISGGYKVQKKGGEKTSTGRKYFSNKPLTKEKAIAQMKAIYASEQRKITSPKRKITSPKRKITSPKRKITSPKRKITSPRRKITSPKRKNK